MQARESATKSKDIIAIVKKNKTPLSSLTACKNSLVQHQNKP